MGDQFHHTRMADVTLRFRALQGTTTEKDNRMWWELISGYKTRSLKEIDSKRIQFDRSSVGTVAIDYEVLPRQQGL